MSTIKQLNKRNNLKPFRRCEIRRRLNDGTGNYETDWTDITSYIKSFGTLSLSLDTETIGVFTQSSMTLIGDNMNSAFADPSDNKSLFYTFLTRYKTLFRIKIGLYDTDGITVIPTNGSVFYGILSGDVNLTENEATLNIISTAFCLQEQSASNLTLLATDTASGIISKIFQIQDSGGNNVFDRFITGTSIATTTTAYVDVTGGSNLLSQSCLDIINRLCLVEDKCAFIDGNGSFYFRAKTSGTDIAWKFIGAGAYDEEYGVNIASIKNSNYIWSKIYNQVVIEHTDGSYVTASSTWEKGDSSSPDKYGEKKLNISEYWLGTDGATALAGSLYTNYYLPKREVIISSSTFNPELKLLDRASVTYYGDISSNEAGIWDTTCWGGTELWEDGIGLWAENKGGIYLNNVSMNIIGINFDLDNFVNEFHLREV